MTLFDILYFTQHERDKVKCATFMDTANNLLLKHI